MFPGALRVLSARVRTSACERLARRREHPQVGAVCVQCSGVKSIDRLVGWPQAVVVLEDIAARLHRRIIGCQQRPPGCSSKCNDNHNDNGSALDSTPTSWWVPGSWSVCSDLSPRRDPSNTDRLINSETKESHLVGRSDHAVYFVCCHDLHHRQRWHTPGTLRCRSATGRPLVASQRAAVAS